jgi:hypothetical protein
MVFSKRAAKVISFAALPASGKIGSPARLEDWLDSQPHPPCQKFYTFLLRFSFLFCPAGRFFAHFDPIFAPKVRKERLFAHFATSRIRQNRANCQDANLLSRPSGSIERSAPQSSPETPNALFGNVKNTFALRRRRHSLTYPAVIGLRLWATDGCFHSCKHSCVRFRPSAASASSSSA